MDMEDPSWAIARRDGAADWRDETDAASIPVLCTHSSAAQKLKGAVRDVSRRRSLQAGEVLFNEGDPGGAFYFVQSGEIEISVHASDGRKLALEILHDGDMFGEIALFGGSRTATARATVDCLVLAVRRADVMSTLLRQPELALQFIDILCARLRDLDGKLRERAFQPLSVRLANRLLYLETKLGRGGQITVSQSDLADFVGTTRESVARILAVWRSRSWVALSHRSIRILNRAAIESTGSRRGE